MKNCVITIFISTLLAINASSQHEVTNFAVIVSSRKDIAEPNSNEVEMDRRTRIKFELEIKKWRLIKENMVDREVRSILGKPKLVIGGYPNIIWFYQDIPDQRKTISESPGHIFFRSQSNEKVQWLNSEIEEYFKIIKKENKYTEKIRPAKKDIQREKINEKKTDFYALNPRRDIFKIVKFKQPDWDRFDEMLPDKDERKVSKRPKEKWLRPDRWSRLKPGMNLNQVKSLFGEPTNADRDIDYSRLYYGPDEWGGEVHFKPRLDLKDYVIAWEEPFWPEIEKIMEIDPNDPNAMIVTPQKFNPENWISDMKRDGVVYSVDVEFNQVRINPDLWDMFDLETKQNAVILFSKYFDSKGSTGRVTILSSRNDEKLATYNSFSGIKIIR